MEFEKNHQDLWKLTGNNKKGSFSLSHILKGKSYYHTVLAVLLMKYSFQRKTLFHWTNKKRNFLFSKLHFNNEWMKHIFKGSGVLIVINVFSQIKNQFGIFNSQKKKNCKLYFGAKMIKPLCIEPLFTILLFSSEMKASLSHLRVGGCLFTSQEYTVQKDKVLFHVYITPRIVCNSCACFITILSNQIYFKLLFKKFCWTSTRLSLQNSSEKDKTTLMSHKK